MGHQSPVCSKKQNRSKTPIPQTKVIVSEKHIPKAKLQPPIRSKTPVIQHAKKLEKNEDSQYEIKKSLDFLGVYLQFRDISEVNPE